ncbi:MAG: sugar ABC transporter permease, partial [Acutalibacteraceae bacterium]
MNRTLKKYSPIFLLPTLICFVMAFVLPFLLGIILSFTRFTTVTNAKWVGLANYITAFTDDSGFINALWFTVKFTV